MNVKKGHSLIDWTIRFCGTVATLIGAFWLVAWFGGWAAQRSAAGFITVKTNMALCQMLGGIALLLLKNSALTRSRRTAGFTLALLVLLIGTLTLSEHLFQYDIGIDQLLATEVPGATATASPNRMGPPGSISVALLGIGLLVMALERRVFAPFFGLATCLINLFPAVGFLYRIQELYGKPHLTGIAWPTVVALTLLGAGLLLIHTESGPIALLLRSDAGGALLRRMLPAVILIPLVLGFIQAYGRLQGLYETAVGMGLLVIALILVFSILLWRAAAHLSRSVEAEAKAHESIHESEARLKHAQQIANVGSWEWDIRTGALLWSDQIYRQMGEKPGQFAPTLEALKQRIHPEDRTAFEVAIDRALAGTAPYDQEFRIIRPNGESRVLHALGEVVYGSDDRPLRMMGICLDITERKQAEQSLRQSREDLDRAQEVGQIGWWRLDTQHNVLTWSDENHRIFGVPKGTPLTYEAFLNCVHPEDRGFVQEQWSAGLQGKPYDIEHRLVVDGKVKWVREKAYLELDSTGKALGGFGITQDITGRKQAEEALLSSKNRLEVALGVAELGSYQYAENFHILSFDAKARDILGIEDPDKPRQVWEDRIHAEDMSRIMELTRRIEKEACDAATAEYRYIHPNRGVIWLRHSVRVTGRDSKGAMTSQIGAVQDITERKQAEEALARSKEELEKRVVERTAELAQRAAQLRALTGELTLTEQRERSRLAKVLHDHLQQLLVAAKFRTTVLGRGGDDVVKQAAKEVEELIDESIAASRSLTAELSPPILHEGGLNAGLQWLARRMADKQGLFVDLDMEEAGDLTQDIKILLFESVRELLFNVSKHAHTRSATINVRRIDGLLQVVVSDQGIGFDPTKTQPAYDGTGGFGLFTIRERLEFIGGEFEIDSKPGLGCRFVLSIPVVAAPKIEPFPEKSIVLPDTHLTAAPKHPDQTRKIRVMLADDHAIVRQGIANLLADEPDIEVVGQAGDGQEALKLAATLLPDVVLMDVSMSKLSGVEATRAICQEFPEMRIIGLSMFDDAERAQAMWDAGAVGYVTKSGPADALVNLIRTSIQAQKKTLSSAT